MLRLVLIVVLTVSLVTADPGLGYGFGHALVAAKGRAPIPHEEHVWAHNAKRQLWVNHIADWKVGSGTGTADVHGVPGTALGTGGYGGYHGHHGFYGGYY